jgi:hypothetical protein
LEKGEVGILVQREGSIKQGAGKNGEKGRRVGWGDYKKFPQIAQIKAEKDIEICENQWNLRKH